MYLERGNSFKFIKSIVACARWPHTDIHTQIHKLLMFISFYFNHLIENCVWIKITKATTKMNNNLWKLDVILSQFLVSGEREIEQHKMQHIFPLSNLIYSFWWSSHLVLKFRLHSTTITHSPSIGDCNISILILIAYQIYSLSHYFIGKFHIPNERYFHE